MTWYYQYEKDKTKIRIGELEQLLMSYCTPCKTHSTYGKDCNRCGLNSLINDLHDYIHRCVDAEAQRIITHEIVPKNLREVMQDARNSDKNTDNTEIK